MATTTSMWGKTAFTAVYSFDMVTGGENARMDPTPCPQVEGLVFSAFEAVANATLWGMGENPNKGACFSFKGWPTGEAMDDQQYYTFSIQAQEGHQFKIDELRFTAGRTGTGIRCFSIRSSKDAYEKDLPAFVSGADPSMISIRQGTIFQLEDVEKDIENCSVQLPSEAVSSLTFRIYAWAAEARTGAFRIDDVYVRGEVLGLSETVVPDDETSSGSDFHEEKDSLPYWVETKWNRPPSPYDEKDFYYAFVSSENPQDTLAVFEQNVRLPRQAYDAVLNLVNMADSSDLEWLSADWTIVDSLENDCRSLFELEMYPMEDVAAGSHAMALLRLIPKPEATVSGCFSYRVGGRFCYRNRMDGESCTQYLHPARIDLRPQAYCRIEAFVPQQAVYASGDSYWPFGLRIDNNGNGSMTGGSIENRLSFRSENVLLPEQSFDASLFRDTLCLDDLAPMASFSFCRKLSGIALESHPVAEIRSAYINAFVSPDTLLIYETNWHRMCKDISIYGALDDTLPDFLVDDQEDADALPDKIYFSHGGQVSLSYADTFYAESTPNQIDTLVNYTLQSTHEGWNYSRTAISVGASGAEITRVCRLSDSLFLPLENVWISEDSMLHIVDDVRADHLLNYAVSFKNLGGLPRKEYHVDLYDSICIGSAYKAFGFDLPIQETAGDYCYLDTLTADRGGDSIVHLNLYVCPIPDAPEQIYGDSIVLRAGKYVYTIKPVPNAAFYVWSVYPSDWTFSEENQGETITLNIPYAGTGRLYVRAANACGYSKETGMELQTSTDMERLSLPAEIQVYPNGRSSGFSLETKGLKGQTTIVISDMSGRKVYSESCYIDESDKIFQFSLDNYPGGMYIISVIHEGESRSGTVLLK